MPMYGRRPSGRAGPRSTRTTQYSAKRRKGGLKRASTRTTKAPVATGYSRRGGMKTQYSMQQVTDTCVRLTGRSYIGAVNNGQSNASSIGLLFDINPTLLGDRVAVMASTYDKYCYQSMKFTYVPQCPTSQPGSVMLVFERDPEAQCANPTGTSYMQEVMSYEHAVLTPAWVSTSVSYKRDPHEVKTWFMSGDNGVTTPRETSQGTFIAYTSNAAILSGGANGNLGFVVMDYVLDLVSPNVLPNKQAIIAPTQYRQAANSGADHVNFKSANGAALQAGVFQQQFTSDDASLGIQNFLPLPYPNLYAAGMIIEIIFNSGANSDLQTKLGIAYNGSATPGTGLQVGQRIYAVTLHNAQDTALSGGPLGTNQIWYFAATLQDAIGLTSANARIATGANAGSTYDTVPAALFAVTPTLPANTSFNQTCWIRIISTPSNISTA